MFQEDLYRVTNCHVGSMDLSDHASVRMDLVLNCAKKSTILRLNTGILNRKRQKIREDIKNDLEENDNGEVSPAIRWDACKAVLRGKIIGYCSN